MLIASVCRNNMLTDRTNWDIDLEIRGVTTGVVRASRRSGQRTTFLPGNRLSSLFESGSLIIRKIGAFRRRRPLTRYSWKEWGAGGVSEGGSQAGRTAAVLCPSLQAMSCTCHRLTRPPPSGIKSQPEERVGRARPVRPVEADPIPDRPNGSH